MITVNLDEQLSGHVFSFLLIFARLGSAIMLFPGFGEAYVASRIRLLFAFSISFLLMPVLMPILPKPPDSIHDFFLLIAMEVVIGIFVGSFLRLLISAIETTGAIIATQLGLSNAMILNPAQATQSALPGAFLGAVAVVLLFITGLDHLMLKGLVNIYDVFPPGKPVMTDDIVQAYVQMASKSFLVGVEISSPFIVMGLLFLTALGLMQRMVMQVQLFLVVLPIQILSGMVLFAATFSIMLLIWLRFFDTSLSGIMVR